MRVWVWEENGEGCRPVGLRGRGCLLREGGMGMVVRRVYGGIGSKLTWARGGASCLSSWCEVDWRWRLERFEVEVAVGIISWCFVQYCIRVRVGGICNALSTSIIYVYCTYRG